MGRPLKVENQMMQQSNYFTTARYDYTVQEKRILYRVLEKAYEYRMENKEWFDKHDGEYIAKEHMSFTMPITYFMNKEQLDNGGGEQYEQVVNAFKTLVDKRISFKGKGCFSFGGILNYADQNKGEGTISFMVHKFVWQSALDFTRGFTKLDIAIAIKLKSQYSMRMYELIKKWEDKKSFILTIEELREMFACNNKYERMYDIQKYILDASKNELDKVSPISFTYSQNKVGKSIKSFTIQIQKKDNATISDYSTNIIDGSIKRWLKLNIGMSISQIKNNVKTLLAFQDIYKDSAIKQMEDSVNYIKGIGLDPKENIGMFISNLISKINNYDKIIMK